MWTKKSHWLYLYIHVRCFSLPLVMPLYVFWELFDAIEDLLLLFGRFAGLRPFKVMNAIAQTVLALTALGRFDLVDVDAGHEGKRAKIKICLR